MTENITSANTMRWKKLTSVAVWLVMIALAIMNILLIRQNLRMRAEITKSTQETLQPGDTVQPIIAQGLRGELITVNYTGREATRVLLFFTPLCPYCHEQIAYWKHILTQANRNHFQILGIVPETEDRVVVDGFLRLNGCEDLRVAFVPRSVLINYKLSVAPTTLVVANTGKVEKTWVGKWQVDTLDDASSVFGILFSQN